MSVYVNIPDIGAVEVTGKRCAMLACLRPGYYTHHTAAGASGCSSRTDDHRSCLTWLERGCPPADQRRTAVEWNFHAPDCEGPRLSENVAYGHAVRSTWGWIRCIRCQRMVPRQVVVLSRAERERP